MDSFLFALNAVAPIVLTVAVGYILKRIGFITVEFAKMANKLVFRLFLPCMLFLNVYNIQNPSEIEFGYIAYAVIFVFLLFFVMIPITGLITDRGDRRGAVLQATFRSNYALIGIPLATALFGESGAAVASILSAVSIPAFNILAVLSLTLFQNDTKLRVGASKLFKKITLGIIKNPLIISVFMGIAALLVRALLVKHGIEWRLTELTPLYTVMKNFSSVSTPLALIVLGAQFEFSAIKELKREIIFGTLARCLFVPVFGLGIPYLFFRDSFGGMHFAALVALFATPVAVSSVPMAQEMDADVSLAGQLVVWTTLFSTVTIFVASYLLKLGGVF